MLMKHDMEIFHSTISQVVARKFLWMGMSTESVQYHQQHHIYYKIQSLLYLARITTCYKVITL